MSSFIPPTAYVKKGYQEEQWGGLRKKSVYTPVCVDAMTNVYPVIADS